MQESIVFLLRVQCRRKENSRSPSHLLMSFLFLHQIVSALLLDDALKLAINETLRHTLGISQGSVATNLRWGGIFSDSIITKFILSLTLKLRRTKHGAIFGPSCMNAVTDGAEPPSLVIRCRRTVYRPWVPYSRSSEGKPFEGTRSNQGEISRLKFTKLNFGWGSAPDPAGGACSAP